MTIKSLLIKAVVILSFQMIVTQVHAQSDTSARIVYFNNLYKGISLSCPLAESDRAFLVGRLEAAGCATKSSANGQPFFVTSPSCGDSGARSKLSPEISTLCSRSGVAQKAQLQADLAAAQKRAQSATGSEKTNLASTADALKNSYSLYKKHSGSIDKINKGVDKYFNKDKKDTTGSVAKSSDSNSKSGNISSGIGTASDAIGATKAGSTTSQVSNKSNDVSSTKAPVTPEGATPASGDAAVSNVDIGVDGKSVVEAAKSERNKLAATANGDVSATPIEAQGTAQEIVDGKGAEAADDKSKARIETSQKEDAAFVENLTNKISTMQQTISTTKATIERCVSAWEADTTKTNMYSDSIGNSDMQHFVSVDTKLSELLALVRKHSESSLSCSKSAAFADNFCSLFRNPTAQKVQYVATVAAAAISKGSSASEVCKTTSSVSRIAQGGMLLAQITCTTFKFKCDISCKMQANNELNKMKAIVAEIDGIMGKGYINDNPSCPEVSSQQNNLAIINRNVGADVQARQTTGSLPAAIAQCQKHAADIGLMAAQAAGLASAAKDAKDCEKKLAAGGSSGLAAGANGTVITTAEFCAKPENAESSTCKCTFNPNAEGCLGAASQGLGGVKTNNGGAASGLAGFGSGAGNEVTPPPVTVTGGLSDEAKSILDAEKAAADGSGSSFGGGSGSAGSGLTGSFGARSSRSDDSDTKSKNSAETRKSKFNFSLSGISSGLSSLFGGKKSGSGSGSSGASFNKEKQEEAIKRKLASDQVRAEVSTASGKSNFDKVKNRYQVTGASLLQGQ